MLNRHNVLLNVILLNICCLIYPQFVSAQTNVSGSITSDTYWDVSGSPYIITGNLLIYNSNCGCSVATLRIGPGVEVRFTEGAGIQLGYRAINCCAGGRLVVEGTPDQRVLFTADGDGYPGFWSKINARTGYLSWDQNYDTLLYCDIEYGGSGGIPTIQYGTNWYIEGCRISDGAGRGISDIGNSTIINSEISNNANDGLYVSNPSISVINTVFSNNSGYGIYGTDGLTRVENCTFTNNTSTLRFACNGSFPLVSGNYFSNNNDDRIEIAGGTLTSNTTIYDNGVPFHILGGIQVYDQSCGCSVATLRIKPGVEMQFAPAAGIQLGKWSNLCCAKARIVAEGTPENRIKFTRDSTLGNVFWGNIRARTIGLVIDDVDYDTLLYCDLEYGGIGGATILYGRNWYIEGCTISNSFGDGINITSGNIKNSAIFGNIGNGVSLSSGIIGSSVDSRCDLYDNGGLNLSYSGESTLNAEYNYWGANEYAVINSSISGNVDFEPWAEYPLRSCENSVSLFCDDFDDGLITVWQDLINDGCTWIENGGYLSTSITGSEQWCIKTVGDQSWDNYVLEAKVRGNSGVDKVLVFRVQDSNNYYAINLRSDYPSPGIDQITFDKMVNGVYTADIVTADYPSENGVWYLLRIKCLGSDFQIYVDDVPVLEYTDNNNPFYTGGIGIACWTGFFGDCNISFDNVMVTYPETPHIHLDPTSLNFTTIQNSSLPAPQTITITNTGGGTLDWYVDEQISWLDIDPFSGTSNYQEITVTINTTGLDPGTYNVVMTVTSSNADNSPQYVTVEYEILGPIVPVVLVHGWSSDSDVWGDISGGMVKWLKDAGHDYVWKASLEPCGHFSEWGWQNDKARMYRGNAILLHNFIATQFSGLTEDEQSRVQGIDIIGHSMGGIVARRYMADYPGDVWSPYRMPVGKLIMLGTPNVGSGMAGYKAALKCPGPAAYELEQGSMIVFNNTFHDPNSTNKYAIWGFRGCDQNGDFSWLCKFGMGAFQDCPNDGFVSAESVVRLDTEDEYTPNWGRDLCHSDYYQNFSLFQEIIEPLLSGTLPAQQSPVREDLESISAQITYQVIDSTVQGVDATGSFLVEANTFAMTFLHVSDTGAAFSLISPSAVAYDSSSTAPDSSVIFINDQEGMQGFMIENAEPGMWQWTVGTADATTSPVVFVIEGTCKNDVLVVGSQSHDNVADGDTLVLIVTATDAGAAITGLTVEATPIWNFDDTASVISLADDGNNGDELSNDGIYGIQVTNLNPGLTEFEISISGAAPSGPMNRVISLYAYSINQPLCGDVNDDGTCCNILDLTYLVDFIFRGGPPAPIPENADLNGDGSPSNILDLTFLVDFIFRGGPAPTCGL